MQDTLVEKLILFSGLDHVNPLLPEFVNCVEDIQFITRDGVGVNVVHDLVHTDESPCPAHTCTAVDQQWTRCGPNVVGV